MNEDLLFGIGVLQLNLYMTLVFAAECFLDIRLASRKIEMITSCPYSDALDNWMKTFGIELTQKQQSANRHFNTVQGEQLLYSICAEKHMALHRGGFGRGGLWREN